MITKDGRDTPIEKLTPENYIVPKGEERAYHAVIEVEQYDNKTGRKLSKPRVQKFGKKIFETHVRASLLKQGYNVTILHDPTEWIKAQQAKAAEAAQAKAKAEQERFDAAVAAAVAKEKDKIKAEILAEMGTAAKAKADAAEAKKTGRPAKDQKEAAEETKKDEPTSTPAE